MSPWEQNECPGACEVLWARAEELQDQELQGRKGFSHLCEQSLCSQRKKFCKEPEQTKGKVTYGDLGEKDQRFVRKWPLQVFIEQLLTKPIFISNPKWHQQCPCYLHCYFYFFLPEGVVNEFSSCTATLKTLS